MTSGVWCSDPAVQCFPVCVCAPETCDLSQRERILISFEGLCLVLHPTLMRKSKECLSAALPEYLNDVLLQLSLDFHLSRCFSFYKWQWVRVLERNREGERGGHWSVGALVLAYLSCTLSLNFLIGPASPVCIATCIYTSLSICHWRSVTSLLFCLPFSSMST